VFYGAMQGPEGASSQAAAWFVEPDRVSASPRARRAPWLRRGDDATSLRAIIVSSLFLVLLAGSLLVGGHAAIDPLLRMAIAARDGRTIGDVVLAMPDGKFCRHMSFDNNTAEIIEGAIERCPDGIINEHFRSVRNFAWVQH
jgi:hypothetical protein